jgi:glycosyltransferase involved in cell wall biosynthesis
MRRLRVALVSTAPLRDSGSMRAYADTLMASLARHAPEIEPQLVELDPEPAGGAWSRRLQTLLMPARAWMQRQRQPELWHVLDGSRAYIAKALGPAPVVVTVHDVIPCLQASGRFAGAPALGAAARALWRGNATAVKASAALVCVSSNTAMDLQRLWAIPEERLHTVPLTLRPGIDVLAASSWEGSREEGTVLHVGNNGFYKNRAGVLRIFARLDRGIARHLVMAGPPPDQELRGITRELELTDRIDWRVDPADHELAALYRRATVLLFPSLYEGFGWPVLEAMSFGLPVVVSDAGSLPQVVGEAASCVNPQDESGFASAVELILRSPTAASAATQSGLAQASVFNSAAFASGIKQAYAAAMKPRAGTAG